MRIAMALWVLVLGAGCGGGRSTSAPATGQAGGVVYQNDFDQPTCDLSAWSVSTLTFNKTVSGAMGAIDSPAVAVCESANGKQRFLGEFGGQAIGKKEDPDWNRTRVNQSVRLLLSNLPKHSYITLSFDLYVLKSWDGNSAKYGPDQFAVRVHGGPVLLDTTFSNNPKVAKDGSYQNYPASNTKPADNAPFTGAAETASLGYVFFKDSVYHLSFDFPHGKPELVIEFVSSLFEGKGTEDESWGIDNVVVKAGR